VGGTNELQFFGDSGIGVIAPNDSLSSLRGRRKSNDKAIVGENGEGLVVGVAYGLADPVCDFRGSILGSGDSEDPDVEEDEEFEFNIDLSGDLVNQPPYAIASVARQNVAVVSWREGSRTGDEVGFSERASTVLGIDESQSYVLRVIDAYGQADEDTTSVAVADTTPPDVTCPADIELECTGLGGASADYAATATDVCDESLSPSCDPAPGTTFPVGTNDVTCSADDDSGNVGLCDFDVSWSQSRSRSMPRTSATACRRAR